MVEEYPLGTLGKKTQYIEKYNPELLFKVPRTLGRDKIGLKDELPFRGIDMWTGTELSWLNAKGKPVIALAEYHFPFSTPYIVESKAFKLYLNSFAQSKFNSYEEVQEVIEKDLSAACEGPVTVKIIPPAEFKFQISSDFSGICLDDLDITAEKYELDPGLLKTDNLTAEETLYTHLLKSNCLATGQPDWGSVLVSYKGPKINHEALLRYFISYRNHSGFAEHCVERIYCDILNMCKPEKLTVYCRYTRRGGLDINPFRSNFQEAPKNSRQIRQ